MKPILILAFLSAVGCLSACADNSGTPQTPAAPRPSIAELQSRDPARIANDNAEELGELIKLPFKPVEVEWREQRVSTNDSGVQGQNERKITAVLRFSTEHSDKIIGQASKPGKSDSVMVETEEWYPDELLSQSELNGDLGLKATSYPADIFFQPPFMEGKLTRIDGTDYFILELLAK